METSESFCCFSQLASVEFPPLSAGLEPQSRQRRQKIRSHMIGGLHVFTANWTIGELHLFVNMKGISFTHKSLLQEKAFETLNKTFFNDIRCRRLLFIVSVYSESFIFSLCDDLDTEERALSWKPIAFAAALCTGTQTGSKSHSHAVKPCRSTSRSWFELEPVEIKGIPT